MKDSLNHAHLLCEDWKRELVFFKEEILIFKTRLNEVAQKNTASDILMQVEHFENKFKIMNNHLDELLHDVNLKSVNIFQQAAAKPQYISVKMIDSDENIQELMEFTNKDFTETKKEFYHFLAKVF